MAVRVWQATRTWAPITSTATAKSSPPDCTAPKNGARSPQRTNHSQGQKVDVTASHSLTHPTFSEHPLGPQHTCVTLGNLFIFSVPSFLIYNMMGWQQPRHKSVIRFKEVKALKAFGIASSTRQVLKKCWHYCCSYCLSDTALGINVDKNRASVLKELTVMYIKVKYFIMNWTSITRLCSRTLPMSWHLTLSTSSRGLETRNGYFLDEEIQPHGNQVTKASFLAVTHWAQKPGEGTQLVQAPC